MSDTIKLEVNLSKHPGNKQPEKKELPNQSQNKPVDLKAKNIAPAAPLPTKNTQSNNLKEQKIGSGKPNEPVSIVQQANSKGDSNGKQPLGKNPENSKKADPKNPNQKPQNDSKGKGKPLEPIREAPKPVVHQIEQSKRRISKNLEELLGQFKEMAGLDF